MKVDKFKILCVIKHEHAEATATAKDIAQWLETRNVDSVLVSSHATKEKFIALSEGCHAGLILGGDGTTLAVARALHDRELPIIGINYGKVGFLTEINPTMWAEYMPRLLNALDEIYNGKETTAEDSLFIDEHRLLSCTIKRKDAIVFTGYAMNDAVISRSNIARAISLSLSINGTHLSDLRCDGLIISTPIGATAYAVAAHGPLALPCLDAQIITPICPFAGAFPPCVTSGTADVHIRVTDINTSALLTLDGQENFSLEYGDILNLTGYKHKIPLLVSDKGWYIKRLNARGFIHHGPGLHTMELDSAK